MEKIESTKTKNASCCAHTCCEEKTGAAEARSGVDHAVRETVRERYAEAVKVVTSGAKPSCCGSSATSALQGADPITRDLYDAAQTSGLPEEAVLASFGCGNPTALADLRAGET